MDFSYICRAKFVQNIQKIEKKSSFPSRASAAAFAGDRRVRRAEARKLPEQNANPFHFFRHRKIFFASSLYTLLAFIVNLLLCYRGKRKVFVHYHQKPGKTLVKIHLDKWKIFF